MKTGKSYEGYHVNNSSNPRGNPYNPRKSHARNSCNPGSNTLETGRKKAGPALNCDIF